MLAFLCVWAFPLLHRLLELLNLEVGWVRVVHAATQCSMGSLNCFVYAPPYHTMPHLGIIPWLT